MSKLANVIMAAAVILGLSAGVAAAAVGEIKTVDGDVVIERDGVEIVAELGAQLEESDVIRTGQGASVGMTFTDNSRMSLGPSSELSLERYFFDGGQGSFDARLLRGSLAAVSGRIARRPLRMRALIPTGVLGVRGTDFAIRVN